MLFVFHLSVCIFLFVCFSLFVLFVCLFVCLEVTVPVDWVNTKSDKVACLLDCLFALPLRGGGGVLCFALFCFVLRGLILPFSFLFFFLVGGGGGGEHVFVAA